jgi:type VI secretion system secreted protein VgrG
MKLKRPLEFLKKHPFTFSEHDESEEKGKSYVLTHISISASVATQIGNDQTNKERFSCNFTCIPKSILFRPRANTPRPFIQGVQTAIVTGSQKEKEIHIDKLARVKVQFHWDREGKHDDHSSCWIRVSQSWAGKGFGSFFTPRVGQEVLVEFLNGDPDQPIIIGSVHNADQVPPNDLHNNKTQSGIKTRSSEGGTEANANELRFDDKKGEELVLLHAEKDHHLEVEKDQKDSIGGSRTTDIKNKDHTKVGESFTIEAGKEIIIKTGSASITLKSDGTIEIKGKTVTVSGKTTTVKGSNTKVEGKSTSVKGASVAVKGSSVKVN